MAGLQVRPALRLAGLASLAGVLSACGPTALEGSLTELLTLHYQTVEVTSSGDTLAVRFYTPRGDGEDLVLAVAANTAGLDVAPGLTVDLAEDAPSGQQRGELTRNVLNDPRTTLPAIQIGTLTLDQLPKETGQSVSGKFNVTFVECINFGCGRTVFGSFKGKVP